MVTAQTTLSAAARDSQTMPWLFGASPLAASVKHVEVHRERCMKTLTLNCTGRRAAVWWERGVGRGFPGSHLWHLVSAAAH